MLRLTEGENGNVEHVCLDEYFVLHISVSPCVTDSMSGGLGARADTHLFNQWQEKKQYKMLKGTKLTNFS